MSTIDTSTEKTDNRFAKIRRFGAAALTAGLCTIANTSATFAQGPNPPQPGAQIVYTGLDALAIKLFPIFFVIGVIWALKTWAQKGWSGSLGLSSLALAFISGAFWLRFGQHGITWMFTNSLVGQVINAFFTLAGTSILEALKGVLPGLSG